MFGTFLDVERQAARQLWWTSDRWFWAFYKSYSSSQTMYKDFTCDEHVFKTFVYMRQVTAFFNSCAVFFFSFIIMEGIYAICKQFHVSLMTLLALTKIVPQKSLLMAGHKTEGKWTHGTNREKYWLRTRQRKNDDLENWPGWKQRRAHYQSPPGQTHTFCYLYFSEISHVSTVQSRLTGSWPEKFQVLTFYRCFSVWSPT